MTKLSALRLLLSIPLLSVNGYAERSGVSCYAET